MDIYPAYHGDMIKLHVDIRSSEGQQIGLQETFPIDDTESLLHRIFQVAEREVLSQIRRMKEQDENED